jgi:hypothetical protein
MKSRAALLFCLSVLSLAGCAKPSGADESFPVFLDRFIREASFRTSRTSLPLLVLVGSPSGGRAAQTWTAEQFKAKFTVPAVKDKNTLTSTPTEVELLQSNLKYRFELKSGRWFLTYFEDSSTGGGDR